MSHGSKQSHSDGNVSGKKPYVGYMRVFGSKVVALKKRPGQGKFDPKSKEYTIVGYSQESKSYRLWDGSHTIIKRRDVRFLEDLRILEEENIKYFEDTPIIN